MSNTSREDALMIVDVSHHAASEAAAAIVRVVKTMPDAMQHETALLAFAHLEYKIEEMKALAPYIRKGIDEYVARMKIEKAMYNKERGN